eukprot:6935399-Pyramimonas_sp.AAC.1
MPSRLDQRGGQTRSAHLPGETAQGVCREPELLQKAGSACPRASGARPSRRPPGRDGSATSAPC